jgi:hypothetical protein
MLRQIFASLCLTTSTLVILCPITAAADPRPPIPAAILPFESRGDVKEEASQVTDLLFVNLIASENLVLVERQSIDKLFEELKLSKAGVVNTDEAVQIGKLTGAKLLITGSVLQVNGDLYLVGKVIATETSRLAGASVKGPLNGDLGDLAMQLATQIDSVVEKKAASLLPANNSPTEWIAVVKKQLQGKKLPTVTVKIPEQHLGQQTFDPAAQTECERLLTELGFTVIAADNPKAVSADIMIKGEAISETAIRRGDFVSVKARVEIQASSQADGKVFASDAETTIQVDLAEQLAGKSGLQQAAQKLLGRVIPQLVK